MSGENEVRRADSRQLSARLYLAGGLVLIGLPLAGFFGASWYAERKRAAEECFRRPERVYDEITEKCVGVAVSADGRRAVGWTREIMLPPSPETEGMTGWRTPFFLFDLKSGRELKTVFLTRTIRGEISRVEIASDARRTFVIGRCYSSLTGYSSGLVYGLDLEGDQGFRRLASGSGGFQRALAFSPDGRSALLCSTDGSLLSLWDLEQDRERRRLTGGAGTPVAAAFSPDGARAAVLTGGDEDGTLRLWDLATGNKLCSTPVIRTGDGWWWPWGAALAFTPDGKRIVVFADNEVTLCDAGSGKMLQNWNATTEVPGCVIAISPDGRRLLAGGQTANRQAVMWLWEIETGRLIRRFEFPEREKTVGSSVTAVAFSPDGRWAFSTGIRDCYFSSGSAWREPRAELLRWRLPDALGYWLLGTEKEKTSPP